MGSKVIKLEVTILIFIFIKCLTAVANAAVADYLLLIKISLTQDNRTCWINAKDESYAR